MPLQPIPHLSPGERDRIIRAMRYFDVPEANRLVPVLDRMFREIRGWVERARKLGERLEQPNGTADQEALRAEREALLDRIREQLQKIEEMGIEVKAVEGLVDFRARLDDQEVYLCWRFGEETVTHWHELDAGFGGRKPIEEPSAFQPSYLS